MPLRSEMVVSSRPGLVLYHDTTRVAGERAYWVYPNVVTGTSEPSLSTAHDQRSGVSDTKATREANGCGNCADADHIMLPQWPLPIRTRGLPGPCCGMARLMTKDEPWPHNHRLQQSSKETSHRHCNKVARNGEAVAPPPFEPDVWTGRSIDHVTGPIRKRRAKNHCGSLRHLLYATRRSRIYESSCSSAIRSKASVAIGRASIYGQAEE